jgi:hypothetical protein
VLLNSLDVASAHSEYLQTRNVTRAIICTQAELNFSASAINDQSGVTCPITSIIYSCFYGVQDLHHTPVRHLSCIATMERAT